MMKSVTKEKVFHVLKLVLLAVTVTLVLLSLLGTVAHNHNIKVESEELKGSVWNFVGQNANYGPGNSTSGVFSKGGDGTCFYPSSTGKATGINDGFVLDATHDHTATSGNTGSGTAHNNLPPYQTIVVWQRTA